ncbi:MAG TPA: hypothetical protein VF020_22135 [Chthoniobacterales bacterium]
MRMLCAISLVLALVPRLCGQTEQPAKAVDGKVETIVFIRHAEKPVAGLGQINCRGLNRALALPAVLTSKFGKPDQIYAPDPAGKVHDPAGTFDYLRPLATIEPTAIQLGMPVSCDYHYDQIKELETELLSPQRLGQLILVVWEHHFLNQMVKDLVQLKGGNPKQVPDWPGSEYDRIDILRIPAENGAITFAQDHENLNHLSDDCPGAK